MPKIEYEGDIENASDGYHTFKELYGHRHALFIALMRSHPKLSWRADNNSDGSRWKGWFVAGMHLPTGDISYHMPNELWGRLDYADIITTGRAPEWDKHTPADVVDRLERWVAQSRGEGEVT